ncbi:hypothetical protein Hypma_007230 [Hypsizygus marmoreus]|uniref:AB hydrolase-1 domain-containing protein n=1 Tax=Hypsizygus marmoreus TaxID=39966 RepID=A0A369KAT9_HYPMA|nr:hypothetical protein Hypma_007230 [Hypsizygus marmoreus]
MPFVKISTPTGAVELHYSISTPTSASTSSIDSNLPCILFLHGEYFAQEVFEAQFSDPVLRHDFNLIAVDMRTCGFSKGAVERGVYTPATAADDLYRFFKALDLPAMHIFGLSIGCYVALEFAHAHPELSLSLTLCSHLPPDEPEEIAAGRLQVYDYWEESFSHDGSAPRSSSFNVDQSMLDELTHGAQQLMFNNQINRLTEATTRNAVTLDVGNWAGSPEKLTISHIMCIEWLLKRRAFDIASLAKQIRCPTVLIHCKDDIGYTLKDAEDFAALMRTAGNSEVTVHQVTGPHFGNVTNPKAVNQILRDHALSVSTGRPPSSEGPHYSADELKGHPIMSTPFTERLAQYGYDPNAAEEWDSDMEIMVSA